MVKLLSTEQVVEVVQITLLHPVKTPHLVATEQVAVAVVVMHRELTTTMVQVVSVVAQVQEVLEVLQFRQEQLLQ